MSKFILLNKQRYAPRARFGNVYTLDNLTNYLNNIPDGELVFIDLETTGLNERVDSVVCAGVSFSLGHFAIDLRPKENLTKFISWLYLRSGNYGAFNSLFDGAFISKLMSYLYPDKPLHELISKMGGDAYVLFKLLANEDKSSRSLGVAVEHILGWPTKDYQKDWLAEKLTLHGLTKGDMSQLMDLEHVGFMKYVSADAEAAYQLYHYCKQFSEYAGFKESIGLAESLYLTDVRLSIEARLHGIKIDMKALTTYLSDVEKDTEAALAKFLSHPQVATLVDEFNTKVMNEWNAPTITTKKIWAKKSDNAHLDQVTWTKGWKNKPAKWEEENGSWFRIEETRKTRERAGDPKLFNPASDTHLSLLFYGIPGNTGQDTRTPLIPWTVLRNPNPEAENPWERRGIVEYSLPDGHTITWEMTNGGKQYIGQDIRGLFGEVGKLINNWVTLEGRREKAQKLLDEASETGRIYPGKRVMATVTGRSGSGGTIGMQTLMKVGKYMQCFIPDEGNVIVQFDFTSLENVIMAEFSRDPLLMDIYASGKPRCGYLHPAIMFDDRGAEIDAVYQSDNATKESVAAAKKQFKSIRTTWKTLALGKQFGIGATKLQRALAVAGSWKTIEETKLLSKRYDEAYAGSTAWKSTLIPEWQRNSGFILNGFGRPMCVPDNQKKDLVSRKIQSTGRDTLALKLHWINYLRIKHGVTLIPMCEIHDEGIFQCKKEDVEKVLAIYKESLKQVNKLLNWSVDLAADPEVADNFNDFKEGAE